MAGGEVLPALLASSTSVTAFPGLIAYDDLVLRPGALPSLHLPAAVFALRFLLRSGCGSAFWTSCSWLSFPTCGVRCPAPYWTYALWPKRAAAISAAPCLPMPGQFRPNVLGRFLESGDNPGHRFLHDLEKITLCHNVPSFLSGLMKLLLLAKLPSLSLRRVAASDVNGHLLVSGLSLVSGAKNCMLVVDRGLLGRYPVLTALRKRHCEKSRPLTSATANP